MGIQGRTPVFYPEDCPYELETRWTNENFTFVKSGLLGTFGFTVHGVMGTKAGDGGDGGKRGDAGLAGILWLVELDQASNLQTYTNNGMNTLIALTFNLWEVPITFCFPFKRYGWRNR